MDQSQTERVISAAEDKFVHALAKFLRSSSVYPEGNPRVQEALEDFLETSKVFFAQGPEMVIRYHRSSLEVQGLRMDLSHHDVAWLQNHLQCVKSAGMVFTEDLDEASLRSFTQRLVHNRSQGADGIPFAALWAEDYLGIKPLEFLLKGEFGEKEDCQAHPESQRAADFFAENPELQRRLDYLVRSCSGEESTIDAAAVLAPVIKDFPETTLADADETLRIVGRVVDGVEQFVLAFRGNAEEKNLKFLEKVMDTVAGRVLGTGLVSKYKTSSPAETSEESQDPPAKRKAEVKDEDPQLVLKLWSDLPREEKFGGEIGAPAEALCGHFHLVVQAKDEIGDSPISEYLCRVLKKPKTALLKVVNTFIAKAIKAGEDVAENSAATKILSFLKRLGLSSVVMKCQALCMEDFKGSFAQNLPLLLDSLKPGKPADVERFHQVCREVGEVEIMAAEADLVGKSGVLNQERALKVLAMYGQELMPLVFLLSRSKRKAYHQPVARFLARTKLTHVAALPFKVYDKPEQLPEQYVFDVCQSEVNGNYAPKVHSYAAVLLQKLVNDLADRPDRVVQRVRAVKALAHFPGAETESFLKDLKKRKGFMGMRKENTEIRDAAKSSLEIMERLRSN